MPQAAPPKPKGRHSDAWGRFVGKRRFLYPTFSSWRTSPQPHSHTMTSLPFPSHPIAPIPAFSIWKQTLPSTIASNTIQWQIIQYKGKPKGRRHEASAREIRRGRAQPCLQRRARSFITSCQRYANALERKKKRSA